MAEVVIQVLDSTGELAREGMFDAAADRTARIGPAGSGDDCLGFLNVSTGDRESPATYTSVPPKS